MLDKLIDFLISVIELFRFWIVLDPYEQGVLLRLGKFVRTIDPGLHWLFPFHIDHCLYAIVVPSVHQLGDESIITKDGKTIGFRAIVTFQIRDIKKAMLEIEDVTQAVSDACMGEVARILRESTWAEVLEADIFDKAAAACRKRGFRYGIEIMSVQFASLVPVKALRLMQR